ncbi:MAG: lysophospholipid acyltransferase family protein [Woeseiaceae bacterium]
MLSVQLLLAFLKFLSKFPYRVQIRMGSLVGRLVYHFANKRRAIAARNIELCFPEATTAERKKLLRNHFSSLGRGLFETGLAYWAPDDRLRDLLKLDGLDRLQASLSRGRGVILITGHFTAMELGGRLLGLVADFDMVIRPLSHSEIDSVVRAGRQRAVGRVIPKESFREFLKGLRANRAILITVDQATTARSKVMAPFFGVPAPTSLVAARIAKKYGAAVLPTLCLREADLSGYRIEIGDPMSGFPTGDDMTDASRLNAMIEEQVLKAPEQYLWIHRRFKNEPSPYE